MKIDFDSIQGGLSVEQTSKYTILRYIYNWSYGNKSTLLRIYEFKTKTIVIASQLNGAVIGERWLISKVVRDFKLDTKYLSWICHIGLFSDFRTAEEKFLDTIIECKKSSIFGQKKCEYIKTEEIDIEEVEKRIEFNLEPVEKWLGLDPMIQEKRREEDRKQKQKLSYFYLQNELTYLLKQNKLQELLPQALVGAFVFYPKQKENNRECLEFIKYSDLEKSNTNLRKIVLFYVTKYHPDKEIVMCICTEDNYYNCIILPKRDFLRFTVK